jgi:hypothetical protein
VQIFGTTIHRRGERRRSRKIPTCMLIFFEKNSATDYGSHFPIKEMESSP